MIGSLSAPPPPPPPFLYRFSRWVVTFFFKIGWRLSVEGVEHIPKEGGVIIAANHRSYADPPLLGVSIPREVHFLAKKELFHFRPFGWLISKLNAHPLDRGGDVAAFKASQRLLSQGYAIIVFPEGRRSKTDQFGKVKPGVGMLAMKSGCPVVPAYIHNSGHTTRFYPLRVCFGAPVFPGDSLSYDSLAEEIMKRVAAIRSRIQTSCQPFSGQSRNG